MLDIIKKNISKYIKLSRDEFNYFASVVEQKRVRKKQFLLEEGEVCRFECFVNNGCLRQYHLDDNGNEHIMQFAIRDWWISDQYSFISGLPSPYFIDALEDSEVLLISKTSLDELYTKVPKFERFFRIAFQNSYVALQRRILANISQTAEERYVHFSKNYPEIEQIVPQHQVASYLGIKPESLSRLRKLRLGR